MKDDSTGEPRCEWQEIVAAIVCILIIGGVLFLLGALIAIGIIR